MTIATNPTRDACQLGNRTITYPKLQREYRCDTCGGTITLKPLPDWHPECARCGGMDFVHQNQLWREKADAVEVLDGLPQEIAALLR